MSPPPLLDVDRSILVLVDLQPKLLDQVERAPLVRTCADRLLRLADIFAVPVLLTEQYPERLGGTDGALLERFEALSVPHRKLAKTSFDCCGDEAFCAALEGLGAGRDQVVLGGIEAHVCVLQTAFQLRRRALDVHLCWDAVSGRGVEHREHALQRMAAAGTQISNHESVGFEWARDKDAPGFKAMQAIFKEGQPR